jgi:hypothetical protein
MTSDIQEVDEWQRRTRRQHSDPSRLLLLFNKESWLKMCMNVWTFMSKSATQMLCAIYLTDGGLKDSWALSAEGTERAQIVWE